MDRLHHRPHPVEYGQREHFRPDLVEVYLHSTPWTCTVYGPRCTVHRMEVLGVVNKKGGAGKTTVTIGLAAALRRLGLRVGVIDTDPNGSATNWLRSVDELDTVPCEAADLAGLIAACADDYDMLIIDSPPNDAAAISSVAAVSDLVIIPVAPTGLEVDQLPDTVELISATGARWVVVPVRVRLSTSTGRQIRELISGAEIPVTRNMIQLREAIAQAFGELPPALSFAPLAIELRELLSEAEVPA